MKIACLRHVAFEGPGIIQSWAEEKGFELHIVRLWQGEALPDMEGLDALIIMGGPMSACDDENFPWLVTEKKGIAKAIDLGIPVLGICLGAQIIANILGARVYPNQQKEIGWFPVEKTSEGSVLPLLSGLPESFITFHWHGDTFDLPEGATHLIRSTACPHQAFIKEKVLGLQFHMEMTEEGVLELIDRCAHELVEAPWIQSKVELSDRPEMTFNHQALKMILNGWIAL